MSVFLSRKAWHIKIITSLLFAIVLAVPTSQAFALDTRCYCAMWLRTDMSVPIWGDADKQRPNKPLEQVVEGDVLLMRYGKVYHVAVVLGFEGAVKHDTYIAPEKILIAEANYVPCKSGTRAVSFTDKAIWGVYNPPYSGSTVLNYTDAP